MSLDLRAQEESIESQLAEFARSVQFEDLPESAVEMAEQCYLDTIGVGLAGSIADPGEKAIAMAKATGTDGGDASVLGDTMTASAPAAAFVNGTSSHALDFDDVTPANIGHPSAPLIAAALSIGELTDASGEDLITAYVAGFEIASRLAAVIHPGHYQAGWHSTGTFGTFSAAGAAISLLDLTDEQSIHAINIAASSPAGVQQNFGSMTKPMHAGQAGRAGVTAGLLAAQDFTADETAITGDLGFFKLYQGPTGIELQDELGLGDEWSIVEDRVQFKKYPCCYCTHAGIAATTELVENHGIEPQDVVNVEVRTSKKGRQILQHDNPQTGFEGKFSIPYTVACAIALDRVGIDAFSEETVNDPDVRHVIDRVNFEADSSIPYDNYTTRVTIETTDGEEYKGMKESPPGRDGNPLSEAELREKFEMCAVRTVGEDATADAYSRLASLRDQNSSEINALFEALTAKQ